MPTVMRERGHHLEMTRPEGPSQKESGIRMENLGREEVREARGC